MDGIKNLTAFFSEAADFFFSDKEKIKTFNSLTSLRMPACGDIGQTIVGLFAFRGAKKSTHMLITAFLQRLPPSDLG